MGLYSTNTSMLYNYMSTTSLVRRLDDKSLGLIDSFFLKQFFLLEQKKKTVWKKFSLYLVSKNRKIE